MNKERLLEVYHIGWNDCPDGNDHSDEYEGKENSAYRLGWNHYILGDDVRSVDYLTNEQILERIHASFA